MIQRRNTILSLTYKYDGDDDERDAEDESELGVVIAEGAGNRGQDVIQL